MNCCDEAGNCRQGRDCPVRLARMGMAVPEDNKPSPEQRQRQELRDWLVWALLVTLLTGALCGLGNFAAGYLWAYIFA